MEFKKGDLLNFTEDAVGHGCNCFNVMGAGVALAIKQKFPEMFRADTECLMHPGERLGSLSWALLSTGKIGINIYSQYDYSGSGTSVDYSALQSGVLSACTFLAGRGLKTLALPKIGCGLAGGNWEFVEKILRNVETSTGIGITIYTLD